MSKHKNEVKVIVRTEEFTTSRGDKIILKAVPPMLIPMLTSSVKFPKVPTYSVDTISGEKEYHNHEVDKEKNVDTRSTPEDYAAWDKFIQDRAEAQSKLTEKLLNGILLEGVDVNIGDINLKRFAAKLDILGLDMPDNEEDIIHTYKMLYVAASDEDMKVIMDTVLKLSGISEEEIEATKDSFQDKVES